LSPALGPLLAAFAAGAGVGALGMTLVMRRDLRRLDALLEAAQMGATSALALPWLPGARRFALRLLREWRRARQGGERKTPLLARAQALLDRLPDPLLVFATDGTPRLANAALKTLIGEDLPALLRHPALRATIEQIVQGGGEAQAEAAFSLPVPVPRELRARLARLPPALAYEEGLGGLAVFDDLSRERAIERTRSDFIANVSHELRTPLSALIGFIETLRGPAANDPAARERFLGIMAAEAERMNRLIGDLLALSRIEAEEHIAPREAIDLAAVLTAALLPFELRLRQAEATLVTDIAEGLPRVRADADQITQVLHNLLDNALKYGRPRGGTVRLTTRSEALGGRAGVLIAVEDDGPGIPKKDLPRLTERFYRVDKGRSRAQGGTGLGLAIVKHIVNRHRGQLRIESEEGRFTRVEIWLPAEPSKSVSP
jgi:two-component system phosphate regulon sensor histidine kinase PhoR